MFWRTGKVTAVLLCVFVLAFLVKSHESSKMAAKKIQVFCRYISYIACIFGNYTYHTKTL